MLIPLATGAAVVLRSDEMLRSVPAFLDACRAMGITMLIFPTAYWHELVVGMAESGLRFPDSVRLVCFGGEKALPERLRQWRDLAGDRVRLWNVYGPTEATIGATFCDLTEWAAATSSPATVPIGKPVANVTAYVLDRRGDLRPPASPGSSPSGGPASRVVTGTFRRRRHGASSRALSRRSGGNASTAPGTSCGSCRMATWSFSAGWTTR